MRWDFLFLVSKHRCSCDYLYLFCKLWCLFWHGFFSSKTNYVIDPLNYSLEE